MIKKELQLALGAACVCLGCTTPQIAMDQANNGVRLTQGLQEELARYDTFMKASAERRIAAIQRIEEGAIRNIRERAMDDYLDQSSGRSTTWMASAQRMHEASQKYASLLADEEKSRQELVDRLAAVTKDLPTPGQKLGAVQKAMADLGTELSAKERFAIVQKFIGESKDIIKQNNAAATASEPAASAPAAAASAGG